jgi:hypothetical protein
LYYTVIDVVARLRAGQAGIRIPAGVSDFLYSKMSQPALGPIQPRIKRVSGDPSEVDSGQGVRLTAQLHVVPRLRLGGAIPPFHHTSSWRVKGQLFKKYINMIPSDVQSSILTSEEQKQASC